MADLAQHHQGWTLSVYKFGCTFIHLSSVHDYNDRDPLEQLPDDERQTFFSIAATTTMDRTMGTQSSPISSPTFPYSRKDREKSGVLF